MNDRTGPGLAAATPPEAPATADDRLTSARLPLAVTVGFSGHRAVDHEAELARQLDETFSAIQASLAQLSASPLTGAEGRLADAYDGPAHLRLLAGAAPGADRLAADRWRAAGLGEIHLLYPFRDKVTGAPLTDHPDHAGPETRLPPPEEGGPWTGFDGVELRLERDQAHAEVARWIVRHADVLIAVWNGNSANEIGGTGDTLKKALERGLPVVWIRPGTGEARLINPSLIHRRADVVEAMTHLESLGGRFSAEALTALMIDTLSPPGGVRLGPKDPEVVARIDYATVDPLSPGPLRLRQARAIADATLWRSFRLFERLVGGFAGAPATDPGVPPPARLAAEPGFVYLRAAFNEANKRAEALSSIHRSQQLLLIIIATVAVLVGALPALAVTEAGAHESHIVAAVAELLLGAAAFLIARLARRAHRHRRWSDARRLSERLRAACATWPIGIDVADTHVAHPQTWTEWRALAALRAAGPIRGWVTRQRFQETTQWVAAELIEGQIAYHAFRHRLAEHIERALRFTEAFAFGLLMLTLSVFVAAWWALPAMGLAMPTWAPGVVSVVSAVAPAVGGACLALEATSGFGELALRNERMQREFERMKAQLEEGHGLAFRHVQDVVRRSAQLLVEDADAWRDRVARRRIVQGG